MTINIRVFREPGADPVCREVEAGTTIEELLYEYRSHLPNRVYTARINNEDVSLTHKIESECDVTFCDIRDDVAFRSFQRALTMLLLKAVHDIYGNSAKVTIRNSVNRGLFTTILYKDPEAEAQAEALAGSEKRSSVRRKKNKHTGMKMPVNNDLRLIEKRMWKIVDANKPIKHVGDGLYRIGKFTCLQYGLMPPSTGSIFPFALEAMRGGVMLRYPHPSDPNRLAVYRRDVRVFDAYDEEQEFLDSLNLGKISDLNERIKAGGAPEIIHMAEDRHTTRIKDIAQYILGSEKKVVLLAGPSSSGKTTTAKRLIEALTENGVKEPLYFGTDDYYVERENIPREKNGEYNFEGLDAIDVDLFAKHIGELLSGKTADLPRYDFINGKKVFGERKSKLKKDQIIIVEGIHALSKKFSASIDDDVKFKFYISPLTQLSIDDNNRIPSTEVRLIRRMVRDHRTRGNSVVDTILMWPKVRAGEMVNIFPSNNDADVVFNSTLVYELPVLKKYVTPLLEEVPEDNPTYATVKRLLHFLSFFNEIEDESPIPDDSVLREFIGGSRFGK